MNLFGWPRAGLKEQYLFLDRGVGYKLIKSNSCFAITGVGIMKMILMLLLKGLKMNCLEDELSHTHFSC